MPSSDGNGAEGQNRAHATLFLKPVYFQQRNILQIRQKRSFREKTARNLDFEAAANKRMPKGFGKGSPGILANVAGDEDRTRRCDPDAFEEN